MNFAQHLLVSSLFTLLIAGSALAATFNDVPDTNDNYVAIEYLVSIGTLEGYEDGTFQANKTINRAELMKVLVAGQGIAPDETEFKDCFPDVGTEWFAKYVCYASEQGWVDGYPDGDFRPAQTVNKVEAVKMLINAMGLDSELAFPEELTHVTIFDDTDSSAWYATYLFTAKELNLLEVSSGNYDPSSDMNRGGVSEYLFRTLGVQWMAEGVPDDVTKASYDNSLRDVFLTTHEAAELIPEGEAEISFVFYDGVVPQVESDEYAEITNIGQGFLELEGYYIIGSKGPEKYTFPELRLDSGESVKVFTNQGDYTFSSEDALWSNSGETVYLYDSAGNEVDSYSY